MSLDSILRATGKNLFDTINAVKLNGASIFSVTNVITVSQNSNATYRSANVLIPNSLIDKTVTLSAKSNTSGANIAGLRIQWVSDAGMASGGMILGRPDSAGNIVVTGTVPTQPNETYNNLCLMFYSNTSGTLETGTTYTATYSDIQLEEGSTATDYEPYHRILQSVKMPSNGENLTPYPYADNDKTENGISFVTGNYSGIRINGTVSSDLPVSFIIVDNLDLTAGNYTFSSGYNGTIMPNDVIVQLYYLENTIPKGVSTLSGSKLQETFSIDDTLA